MRRREFLGSVAALAFAGTSRDARAATDGPAFAAALVQNFREIAR